MDIKTRVRGKRWAAVFAPRLTLPYSLFIPFCGQDEISLNQIWYQQQKKKINTVNWNTTLDGDMLLKFPKPWSHAIRQSNYEHHCQVPFLALLVQWKALMETWSLKLERLPVQEDVETITTAGLINQMRKHDKNPSCSRNPASSNAEGAKCRRRSTSLYYHF